MANDSLRKAGTPEAPQIQHEGPDAAPIVLMTQQIDRVMNAFLVPGGNPLQEMVELDRLYILLGSSAQPLVESTARKLLAEPRALDNLNFQSSLLTNGSNFFGATLRRMGELVDAEPALAEGAKLPVLIRLVEHHRRGGNGDAMSKFAVRVEQALYARVQANEPLALGQLAKVRYEQSMHSFNQKDFQGAIAGADESAALCERAGDQYGVLAARGNSAGLSRYEWARSLGRDHPDYRRLLGEGRPILEADLETVRNRIARSEKDSPDQRSFSRVEMNNAAHLMQIADLTDDLDLARKTMEVLGNNPLYQSAFDPKYPGDLAHAQEWIRPYPAILQRLESLKN